MFVLFYLCYLAGHHLFFNSSGGTPTSNPYVPLNYSLVDQKQFFKKLDNVDISDILNVINNYTRTKWPYSDDELDEIEWITEDQPLTHVQVLNLLFTIKIFCTHYFRCAIKMLANILAHY